MIKWLAASGDRMIALSAAIYFLCGGVALGWMARKTQAVSMLICVALLIILWPLFALASRRRERAAQKMVESAASARTVVNMLDQPGTVLGTVVICRGLDVDGQEGGTIEIEVRERGETGLWEDITDPGPVAVVVENLAQELRKIALLQAHEESSDE